MTHVLGKPRWYAREFNDQAYIFYHPNFGRNFPSVKNLAQALSSPDVARQFEKTCAIKADGTFLRLEYMQDIDGMWLEPHP